MAINNSTYGKGIVVASGFDLSAKAPLDSRCIVNTIQERDAHVNNNRAYIGMTVYVLSEDREYRYNGLGWDEQLIPKKLSQLTNDLSLATESFVLAKIAEAELSGEDVDLSGYATKDDLSSYTTTIDLNANFATKNDLSGYATTVFVQEQLLPLKSLTDDVNALTHDLATHEHTFINEDDINEILNNLN